VLERDITGVIRFFLCVKWYQSFGHFLAMAGDNDGLQGVSTRIDTVEGKISALELILDSMVQEQEIVPQDR